MLILNNLIRAAFTAFGYRITKKKDKYVAYSLFKNITMAYETLLFENQQVSIDENDLRYQLLCKLKGTLPAEAYFIIAALAKTKNLDGDVCEFGVAQGVTSALIANEINNGKKLLHLFDSFEGLPAPSEMDTLKDDISNLGTIDAYRGTMSFSERMVQGQLKSIGFDVSRYYIHKGFVENVLITAKNLPERVSFAYVDFDFYTPILSALEYLHNVCVIGSIIIVDDYDFFSTGAKKAVDDFVVSKNELSKKYELLIPNKKYGCFAIINKIS